MSLWSEWALSGGLWGGLHSSNSGGCSLKMGQALTVQLITLFMVGVTMTSANQSYRAFPTTVSSLLTQPPWWLDKLWFRERSSRLKINKPHDKKTSAFSFFLNSPSGMHVFFIIWPRGCKFSFGSFTVSRVYCLETEKKNKKTSPYVV